MDLSVMILNNIVAFFKGALVTEANNFNVKPTQRM